MLVSIIIPVYNVEKYLNRCMKSVFEQTYQELQIILVDDGSTDRSPSMCDEYAVIDNRIKVIHKQNEGVGCARNNGFEIAIGEYVFFLDSDDWLPENAIETLVSIAKDEFYDVIRAVHYIKKGNVQKVAKYCFTEGVVKRSGSKEEKERYRQIKTSSTFGYVWGALYRKEFLDNHQILFDDYLEIYMEDTLFNLKVFAYNPNYYVICKPVYCYSILEDSLSNKMKLEDLEISLLLLEEYSQYLNNIGLYEDNLDLLVPLLARQFCFIVTKRLGLAKHSYQQVKEVIGVYEKNEVVRNLLAHKGAIGYLKMISSKSETIFYSFCLFFLKHKSYGFLATVFIVLRPFLNRYINTHLKV